MTTTGLFNRTHRCGNCRYWDAHSSDLVKGDCKVPGDHRYSRVKFNSIDRNGKVSRISALLDSFGPEETRHDFVCGRWDDGKSSPPFESAAQDGRP